MNEVQKFTFSRRKDTNSSDVTVTTFFCRRFMYLPAGYLHIWVIDLMYGRGGGNPEFDFQD